MCTVTYIPTSKGFFFTSNRDEQAARKTVLPSFYEESGVSLFYPKDEVAGGTWIGLAGHQRLVCLLNGGFVYHNPKIKFANSRGIVVKEILTSKVVKETLDSINLIGVAPFTLVVVDWSTSSKVYQLVWCKGVKYVKELDSKESYIWSSSTLYTEEMKEDRKMWFDTEILSHAELTQDRLLDFHQNKNLGTVETAPKMKRKIVETISTTMVIKEDDKLSLEYHDYVNEEKHSYANVFDKVNV